MKILSYDEFGSTVRYEPGDCVVFVRDCCIGDKQITAGESGTVVRLVSTDDCRLAHQLYIELQLTEGEPIKVLPTEVKPAEIQGEVDRMRYLEARMDELKKEWQRRHPKA